MRKFVFLSLNLIISSDRPKTQTGKHKSALDKTQQQDCKKQWSYWSLYCNVGVVLKLDLCRLAVEQAAQFMETSLQIPYYDCA